MASWTLEILGKAILTGADKTLHPERKTIAVLTYLALEGPTPRARIAGLLWPDSGESGARTNLRQLLSRLKKFSGVELVTATDLLSLQGLEVDAAKLKVLAFSNSDEALQLTGELLAPYDYDDCPDFADWLFAERERFQVARQTLLEQKVVTLEQSGNYSEALHYAEQVLLLGPLSEDAHRQVMRLHYLCGDRAAALAAFERCKTILDKELGVEPMEATLKLVSEIEFGAALPVALPTAKQKTELPLRVLRPPLVGREKVLELMDEAWQRRQLIFVSGVAGVGKSRLIQEFLARKESKCAWFAGRLSDIHVPYATVTRSFRQVLAEFPVTPEPWVQRELARVLPELGDVPEAMKSESELLRFYEAQDNVLRLAQTNGMQVLVYEDAHHIDTASLEAFLHFGENHWAKDNGLNMIVSFRPDEIRPDEAFADKTIRELVAADLAVLIELQPLTDVEVNQLVTGLGIADLEELASQLSQYTGGNPFFIIETIKHLIEEDKLAHSTLTKPSLPASGKVFALLKERLSRLSTEAQRLVWTAAIAETEFSIDLASNILAKSPFDLAEPFAELSGASIFDGVRFSHDLIFETALLTIPAPIKVYLHRRCAEELEKVQASPGIIAEHWLSAGDEERAVPHLLEAVQQAIETFRLREATDLLEQVARNFERQGNNERALEVWFDFIEILETLEITERLELAITHSLELAKTPRDFARAHFFQAEYLNRTNQAARGEGVARKGFEYALYAEERYRPRLLSVLAESLWYQGQEVEAVEVMKQALPIAERLLEEYADLGSMYANMAVFHDVLERHREAIIYHQKALELFKQQDNQVQQVTALVNLSISQVELGCVKESLQTLLETERLYAALPSKIRVDQLYSTLASVHTDLCDYSSAKQYLTKSLELTGTEFMQKFSSYSSLARVFTCLGDYETATKYFDQAIEGFSTFPSMQAKALVRLAETKYFQNMSPAKLIARSEKLLQKNDRVLARIMLLLLQATVKQPQDTLGYAKQALDMTKMYDLCGLQIAAESKCSQVYLKLKQFRQALEHTENSLELLETYEVNDVYYGDILLANYQTLHAVKDKRSEVYLEQTLSWLLDITDNNVPSEYRESFLNNNPTNKAILEAAKAKGLVKSNAPA